MNLLTVLVLNLLFILISTFVYQSIFVGRFQNFYQKFSRLSLIILAAIQILFGCLFL